jgi:Na+/H+ antiporter NhaD/arsenite permease-like protein
MVVVFLVGYLSIALEHPLKIDKAATALITGVLCWLLLYLGLDVIFPQNLDEHFIEHEILEHVGEIAQILFFLLGAMTIVEIIDAHHGFDIVTSLIKTKNRVKLLWIIAVFTFFFSAVLDNLTTAIVMATLLKKIFKDKEDLWTYAGIVILAANAGGAWSPIGDVTTIMLWASNKVSAANLIANTLVPSIICILVPLIILTFSIKGSVAEIKSEESNKLSYKVPVFQQKLVLILGVVGLLFVPVFKNITHLPPFMGMMLSLGVLWVVTEIMHNRDANNSHHDLSVAGIIRRIDTPSVLFFLGILLAVASLQTAGHLTQLSLVLDNTFHNLYIINALIGVASSIVDNVPIVAGVMGMYSMEVYPKDHVFWELLAYCAGTGGSILIIGSAAGVAIMGILKIDFIWYLKKISWLALIGYLAGFAFYYFMNS